MWPSGLNVSFLKLIYEAASQVKQNFATEQFFASAPN